jgi:limonene-1,2-epoxide hydrolase
MGTVRGVSATVTPSAVVDAFIAAIERLDLEGAIALLDPEVVYDNVPLSPVHGHDGVRATLGPFLAGCTATEWRVLHQAVSGDVVINERVDRFLMAHGWVELRVAGVFVLHDGKITVWRDYFDMAELTSAMTPPS